MDRYQILVKNDRVEEIMAEWMMHGTSDVRVRRAKTMGCCVIETYDPMFCARIIKWIGASERVNIVHE